MSKDKVRGYCIPDRNKNTDEVFSEAYKKIEARFREGTFAGEPINFLISERQTEFLNSDLVEAFCAARKKKDRTDDSVLEEEQLEAIAERLKIDISKVTEIENIVQDMFMHTERYKYGFLIKRCSDEKKENCKYCSNRNLRGEDILKLRQQTICDNSSFYCSKGLCIHSANKNLQDSLKRVKELKNVNRNLCKACGIQGHKAFSDACPLAAEDETVRESVYIPFLNSMFNSEQRDFSSSSEVENFEVSSQVNSFTDSQLKEYRTRKRKKDEESSSFTEDGEYEVERILEHSSKDDKTQYHYKVRWRGYSSDEDSWVPESQLNCSKLYDEYWRNLLGNIQTQDPEISQKTRRVKQIINSETEEEDEDKNFQVITENLEKEETEDKESNSPVQTIRKSKRVKKSNTWDDIDYKTMGIQKRNIKKR